MRMITVVGWSLLALGGLTLAGCSSESTPADEEENQGGASGGGAPGEGPAADSCELIGVEECEADDRCTLATTFDCEAWEDVSYCVSKDADCVASQSSRGVALFSATNITEGQCYTFEDRCESDAFRAPEGPECEVCDF